MSITGNGLHKRSRKRLKLDVKEKGKVDIKKALQSFEIGDKIIVDPDSRVQRNLPQRSFFGSVVGYLIAGLMIGPFIFNFIQNNSELQALSSLSLFSIFLDFVSRILSFLLPLLSILSTFKNTIRKIMK